MTAQQQQYMVYYQYGYAYGSGAGFVFIAFLFICICCMARYYRRRQYMAYNSGDNGNYWYHRRPWTYVDSYYPYEYNANLPPYPNTPQTTGGGLPVPTTTVYTDPV